MGSVGESALVPEPDDAALSGWRAGPYGGAIHGTPPRRLGFATGSPPSDAGIKCAGEGGAAVVAPSLLRLVALALTHPSAPRWHLPLALLLASRGRQPSSHAAGPGRRAARRVRSFVPWPSAPHGRPSASAWRRSGMLQRRRVPARYDQNHGPGLRHFFVVLEDLLQVLSRRLDVGVDVIGSGRAEQPTSTTTERDNP